MRKQRLNLPYMDLKKDAHLVQLGAFNVKVTGTCDFTELWHRVDHDRGCAACVIVPTGVCLNGGGRRGGGGSALGGQGAGHGVQQRDVLGGWCDGHTVMGSWCNFVLWKKSSRERKVRGSGRRNQDGDWPDRLITCREEDLFNTIDH